MEDREVEPELLSNLVSVFRNISIKQAFNFAPRAERRMIVNRRAKKVARVFFRAARFLPLYARSPSAARCPESICFTRKMSSLVLPLPFRSSLPPGHSVRRSSSFCSCSRRGEAAPRASRCFICLSALFITCNLALTRARVISYWFSTPLPLDLRAVASSPPPVSLSSPSLHPPLLRFFCLSSGRRTSSVTSVLGVDCYANEKCRKATGMAIDRTRLFC